MDQRGMSVATKEIRWFDRSPRTTSRGSAIAGSGRVYLVSGDFVPAVGRIFIKSRFSGMKNHSDRPTGQQGCRGKFKGDMTLKNE